MNEPRKPIFGFLWPAPDPTAPVDVAYRQVRRVRITNRGPIRIAALVVGTLVLISATGSLLMAALTTSLSATVVVGAAISATLLVLILRGWVVGTFVNDDGLTIETAWRRIRVPWSQVAAVRTVEVPSPFLGLPIPLRCARSVVECSDGRVLATHAYESSPDLWLRSEAFDIARIRLEQWADHT
jgi:hypothetical protein